MFENDGLCSGAAKAWAAGEVNLLPWSALEEAAEVIELELGEIKRTECDPIALEGHRSDLIAEAVKSIADEFGDDWSEMASEELNNLVGEVV